jgi:Domain of unknown function (DUF5069)
MWIPRSANDELQGLPWLPRLLEKARRFEAGRSAGTDLMNGYLYGDNDFIDAQLLAFLRASDETVSELVRGNPDDADVARILVERSGRTPSEVAAFAKTFRKKMFGFFLTEADEGRLGNGFGAKITRFVYNRVMMPVIYKKFAADERKRRTSGSGR